ncbi:hypothetical protein F5Y12DRAFT_791771 [Xylaria sp. FL1777]|nr:hypothetical protein F5Y12DRAFT_791771 [Xylaria sp. FL1777]
MYTLKKRKALGGAGPAYQRQSPGAVTDIQSNTSSPYNTRRSGPQSSNIPQRSVKHAADLRNLEYKTISKNNTANENSRRSASFAYLGSKLTNCHDKSPKLNPFQATDNMRTENKITITSPKPPDGAIQDQPYLEAYERALQDVAHRLHNHHNHEVSKILGSFSESPAAPLATTKKDDLTTLVSNKSQEMFRGRGPIKIPIKFAPPSGHISPASSDANQDSKRDSTSSLVSDTIQPHLNYDTSALSIPRRDNDASG